MTDMFNNYPQPEGYIPNNRPRHRKPFCLDIMAGETAVHTFEIPFNVNEACNGFEVIYKLGLTTLIIKNSSELEIIIGECGNSLITCTLTPEETALFADTLLDAKVQIKFYMKDEGTVSYSEVYKIKLLNSLDTNEPPVPPEPQPGTIGGIGYTED